MPYTAVLVVSFGRSVIIARLWRPEVATPGHLLSILLHFYMTPYGKIMHF